MLASHSMAARIPNVFLCFQIIYQVRLIRTLSERDRNLMRTLSEWYQNIIGTSFRTLPERRRRHYALLLFHARLHPGRTIARNVHFYHGVVSVLSRILVSGAIKTIVIAITGSRCFDVKNDARSGILEITPETTGNEEVRTPTTGSSETRLIYLTNLNALYTTQK